jgi:2-polyprenyl-3-methyl-5-hydroxy-6-metoxy-1,4-benzoquinol methylase
VATSDTSAPRFRHSWAWQAFRRIGFLRSGVYLAIELKRLLLEPQRTNRERVDRDFRLQIDPFRYATNPIEHTRFCQQQQMLEHARGAKRFPRALEIGGAEGVFTEVLADRCDSLLVTDVSSTALARSRARRHWDASVHFEQWDLLRDPIPGSFDLIVVAGVLEYFTRPRTLRRVRTKLAESLNPEGYLLVASTRANPVIENSWWGRSLVRGKWINEFVARHQALQVVENLTTEKFAITLLRRSAR